MEGPWIEVERVGDVSVVRFTEKALAPPFASVRDDLRRLVQDGARKVLFDLSGVQFLDSSRMGELLGLRRALLGQGGQLRLCSVGPDQMEIFTITRLVNLFAMDADRAAGLAAF